MVNQKQANRLLSIIEDDFIKKYENNLEGFLYLCVKKSSDENSYYFELGFNSVTAKEDKIRVKEFINNELKSQISVILSNKSGSLNFKRIARKLFNTIEKITIDSKLYEEESFDFHKSNDDIVVGEKIIRCGSTDGGTLGTVVQLKYQEGYFLITNHHVILEKGAKIGDCVFNHKNKKIGEVFWGKFDKTHDVALVRITLKDFDPKSMSTRYCNPIKPSSNNLNVKGIGARSGPGTGTLYSNNAIVKIKNHWFKNQILIDGLVFHNGDSGTVIVKEKSHKTLGVYIGGGRLKTVNKLHTLFNISIKKHTDVYNRKMPKIQILKIY